MGLFGHHGVAVITRQPNGVVKYLRATAGLVEPRSEVDPKSSRDVLVLRGREC
jgi:hypothetical protein